MKTHLRSEKGMALLVALMFVAVAVFLLDALSLRLIQQKNQVDIMVNHKAVFFGLESAYKQSRTALENGDDGMVGVTNFIQPSTGFTLPTFDDAAVTPLQLTKNPHEETGIEYYSYPQDWSSDGVDNDGDGTVDDTGEVDTYTIHSFARKGNVSRQSEAVLTGDNVNVWNNAIFADAGQGGNLINGNVSIHGSVHLLGNDPDDDLVQVLDLSGTSLISNNYSDIPATLSGRIPALDTVDVNGEDVQTLETKLRIKQGKVTLWGNSHVGTTDVAGNVHKETIKGIYADADWAVLHEGNINSDNGMDEGYDLGDRVSFPLLSDPWKWPANNTWGRTPGSTEPRPDNPAVNYTHEEFFSEVLLANPNVANDGIYVGNIDLYTKGQNFYWNASTNTKTLNAVIPAATITAARAANQDFLYFDAGSDVVQTNGQLRINGTLTFRGQGNQKSISYTGRAAILTTGNVTIDTDLLTCNGGNPASFANSYPVNNIIGIMSKANMLVGGVSNIDIMGAFYAQGYIKSTKQTNVAGTFVANFFDMGSQVPSIFQVPKLAANLPFGMVGDYPILVLEMVYWREAGMDGLLTGN